MASAANAIDEEWVEKKLKGANNTQDSVQSLSLWALNHKTQHEKIVGIWFKVMKTAKLDLRLTLFYLCNEVVQTCKRKHAIVFKDAFKDVLKDAALLVRDNSIRPNIERIFKIWEERHIYNKEFVDELMSILNNTKVKSSMSTRLLAEFKPEQLMKQLKHVAEKEEEVEEKRLQLCEQEWDSVDVESFKQQLKDRHECGQYVDRVYECRTRLDGYVVDLQSEIQDKSALIQLLEQSELYYDAQNGEANIVATAYKNFGSRVNTLHKKLNESRKPKTPSSYTQPASFSPTGKSRNGQLKALRDPGATPTEDEFDDDDCEGTLVNNSELKFYSSDTSTEEDSSRHNATQGGRRNSAAEEPRSPVYPVVPMSGDVLSSLVSLLPNFCKGSAAGATNYLPSMASHHGSQPVEPPGAVGLHGFGQGTISNNSVIDEDAGGATPVQDEEPNEDVVLNVGSVERLKQIILDSNKASVRRTSTGTDHLVPYQGHTAETGPGDLPMSSEVGWTSYDASFGRSDGRLGSAVVYEGYEENYEIVYPSEVDQETSATVFAPDALQTYEVYTPAYGEAMEASQTYVVEAMTAEGFPGCREAYETVLEAYPPTAEYQGHYQDQLVSTVAEDNYGEVGEVYQVTAAEPYQAQTISGSYYGVLEQVPPQQPSVVYHAIPNYQQPPPAFSHPPPSLTPSPSSFSHPPPTYTQPPLSFVQPAFTGPPPSLTQPLPPLFTLTQSSPLPPPPPRLPLSHSFVEPPPSPFRLLAPVSAKVPVGLPSTILVPPSPLLPDGTSVPPPTSPYQHLLALKPWMNKPYNQFKNDLVRGSATNRDGSGVGRFDNISDPYRANRIPAKPRRTNLTYLTQVQTKEENNGMVWANERVSLSPGGPDIRPCNVSTALRSLSLPCDAQSDQSLPRPVGRTVSQSSMSPRSVDFLQKSQSFESLSDAFNADEGKDSEAERDDVEMQEVDRDGSCDSEGNSRNYGAEKTDNIINNTFSSKSSTTCKIPSLGSIQNTRATLSRCWNPRFPNRTCWPPEFNAVPSLASIRFRQDGNRRFPRKPYFSAHRLPFPRNF